MINVDIRFSDGAIFQCPQTSIKHARDFAKRVWEAGDKSMVTGIMVTRWNGNETVVVVTHGQSFTY